MKKHFYLSVFLCLLSFSVFAESLTPGFYNSANGLKDGALKDALKSLIRDHTAIPYGSGASSTWGVFFYSDRNDEGLMMDMYCDDWSYVSNPGDVAGGCNIEHSFAKSWWGGAKNDAYKDCYHLNPSNSTANSARSNYPLGVPETDIKTSGSLKVGKIHHPTLNVDFSVFEPKDEYKGDFARAYFYMATCYGHWSNGEIDDVLSQYNGWRVDNAQVGSKYAMQNDNYLEFQPWEQEILIQWHRQDPVSEKEIKRMDAVSNFQHNRNPFIDYPYLAEYIWGSRAGEALDMSKLVASSDATFVPGVSNGWNGEGGSTVDPEDPPTIDPEDPEDNTITVAKAMEIGAALANGAKTTEEYVIEGYVSNISSFYNPDYGNEVLWITDNPYSTAASKEEGAFEIYRGVPNTNAEVGYGAKVRITCKIKKYNNTIIENDGTNIPFEVLEPSTFVPETPTVAEAAATAQYMDAGVKQLYYSVFKGYIQSVTTAYKNGVATFKMADTKDAAEGDLVAFKTTILKADTLKLVPGAYVQVTGYLMNYGGTAEIAQGAIAAFVPEPLVLEEVNCNVRYLDKNAAELSSEVLTFHVPEAPAIDGFTFLRWEFVAGDMAAGLTIQAVYKPTDDMTDLPSEIQVPGNKAMKLVRDGNVYILKGDQVFTIHGQRVH
jgi:endonuclease I